MNSPAVSKVRRYVLDANALIGFYENRPGSAARVERLLEQAFRRDLPLFLSAVNWGEIFYTVYRMHGESAAREKEVELQQLPVVVVPADFERATRAATLKQKHGLGYADSFAAELAIERGASLVTADPEFLKLGKVLPLISLPRHEK